MHAEVIKVITDIEQAIDTGRLMYRGVSYWPLARARIWGGLLRKVVATRAEADPPPLSANAGPQWADVGRVNAALAGPQALGLLTATPARAPQLDPQILFFCPPRGIQRQGRRPRLRPLHRQRL